MTAQIDTPGPIIRSSQRQGDSLHRVIEGCNEEPTVCTDQHCTMCPPYGSSLVVYADEYEHQYLRVRALPQGEEVGLWQSKCVTKVTLRCYQNHTEVLPKSQIETQTNV